MGHHQRADPLPAVDASGDDGPACHHDGGVLEQPEGLGRPGLGEGDPAVGEGDQRPACPPGGGIVAVTLAGRGEHDDLDALRGLVPGFFAGNQQLSVDAAQTALHVFHSGLQTGVPRVTVQHDGDGEAVNDRDL
jgi:hypothetical protein